MEGIIVALCLLGAVVFVGFIIAAVAISDANTTLKHMRLKKAGESLQAAHNEVESWDLDNCDESDRCAFMTDIQTHQRCAIEYGEQLVRD